MQSAHHKSASVLYYEYKDSPLFAVLVFLVSVILCISLLMFFVIPQFQSWMTMNGEVEATKQRIAVMEKNIQYIRSLDEGALDKDLLTATSAYPPQKDFGGAMQAILASAANAGVSLDTFEFSVGSVSSTSAATNPRVAVQNNLALDITIDVLGDPVGVEKFMTELSKKLPLALITAADNKHAATGVATLSISFPSKPLSTVSYDSTTTIVQMPQKNRQLLDELASWQLVPEDDGEDASGSAISESPF